MLLIIREAVCVCACVDRKIKEETDKTERK